MTFYEPGRLYSKDGSCWFSLIMYYDREDRVIELTYWSSTMNLEWNGNYIDMRFTDKVDAVAL